MENKESITKEGVNYEPKKKHQWLVTFPKSFNIESWVVKSTNRPSVIIPENFNPATDIPFAFKWNANIIQFVDPIGPSTTERLFEILRAINSELLELNIDQHPSFVELVKVLKDGFDYDLELTDPTGTVVEKWTMKGCYITEINFGELDYNNKDAVECVMVVQPKTVKLHI